MIVCIILTYDTCNVHSYLITVLNENEIHSGVLVFMHVNLFCSGLVFLIKRNQSGFATTYNAWEVNQQHT